MHIFFVFPITVYTTRLFSFIIHYYLFQADAIAVRESIVNSIAQRLVHESYILYPTRIVNWKSYLKLAFSSHYLSSQFL